MTYKGNKTTTHHCKVFEHYTANFIYGDVCLTGIWSTFVVKSEHQNDTFWDKIGLCAKTIITIRGSISTQLRGHM
jgi:hypothetical protein